MDKNDRNGKWPIYYSDTIHLSNPDSEVAVVCLWTKKERVIEKLDPEDYCYVGQLYSREYGLQILLRNLLANPHIRHLVVCGVDLNNSANGLINFFKEGVDDDNRVKGTDVYLDGSLGKEHIATLWQRIRVHDMREKKDFSSISRYLKRLPKLGIGGEPIIIPLPDIGAPSRFPTDFSGFKVRGKDFSTPYSELLRLITRFGVFNHLTKRLEALNITLFVSKLTEDEKKYLNSRKGRYKLRKRQSLNEIQSGKYNTYHIDEIDAWDELEDAMKQISKETDSNICLMISKVYLNEEDLEDVIETAGNESRGMRWDPDPHGSLVIRVEGGKIHVSHLAPDGRVLEEFQGTTAKELYRKLSNENRVSMLYHAFDIGAELQKAEIAVKEGKKYVQDRNI